MTPLPSYYDSPKYKQQIQSLKNDNCWCFRNPQVATSWWYVELIWYLSSFYKDTLWKNNMDP